jgi:hypothetical protein
VDAEDERKRARKEAIEAYATLALDIERVLRLPDGLTMELALADDWSFVIRSDALLEAAASSLLLDALGDERLDPIITKMQMWQRLRFLKALELWTLEQLAFADALGSLRNALVHDISNTRFTFATGADLLSEKQREVFGPRQVDHPDRPGEKAMMIGQPKGIILWHTIDILAKTMFTLERREIERDKRQWETARLQELEDFIQRLKIREPGKLNGPTT